MRADLARVQGVGLPGGTGGGTVVMEHSTLGAIVQSTLGEVVFQCTGARADSHRVRLKPGMGLGLGRAVGPDRFAATLSSMDALDPALAAAGGLGAYGDGSGNYPASSLGGGGGIATTQAELLMQSAEAELARLADTVHQLRNVVGLMTDNISPSTRTLILDRTKKLLEDLNESVIYMPQSEQAAMAQTVIEIQAWIQRELHKRLTEQAARYAQAQEEQEQQHCQPQAQKRHHAHALTPGDTAAAAIPPATNTRATGIAEALAPALAVGAQLPQSAGIPAGAEPAPTAMAVVSGAGSARVVANNGGESLPASHPAGLRLLAHLAGNHMHGTNDSAQMPPQNTAHSTAHYQQQQLPQSRYAQWEYGPGAGPLATNKKGRGVQTRGGDRFAGWPTIGGMHDEDERNNHNFAMQLAMVSGKTDREKMAENMRNQQEVQEAMARALQANV